MIPYYSLHLTGCLSAFYLMHRGQHTQDRPVAEEDHIHFLCSHIRSVSFRYGSCLFDRSSAFDNGRPCSHLTPYGLVSSHGFPMTVKILHTCETVVNQLFSVFSTVSFTVLDILTSSTPAARSMRLDAMFVSTPSYLSDS